MDTEWAQRKEQKTQIKDAEKTEKGDRIEEGGNERERKDGKETEKGTERSQKESTERNRENTERNRRRTKKGRGTERGQGKKTQREDTERTRKEDKEKEKADSHNSITSPSPASTRPHFPHTLAGPTHAVLTLETTLMGTSMAASPTLLHSHQILNRFLLDMFVNKASSGLCSGVFNVKSYNTK